ncbi:MAG: hypothetical protein ACI8UO_000223 [Verrucomicrobiales bacterium]
MLVVLVVGSAGWIWWVSDWSPWFSSADAPRPRTPAWEQRFDPQPILKPGPEFTASLVELNLDGRVRIHYDPRETGSGSVWPYNLSNSAWPSNQNIWADENGVVELPGGGTARLEAVAFEIWDAEREAQTTKDHVPAHFRNPTTQQLLTGEARDDLVNRLDSDANQFSVSELRGRPRLRAVFRAEDREIRWVRPALFDRRTHKNFLDWRSETSEDTTVVDFRPLLWHEAPLLIIFDLAIGPPVEFHIPAEPNWQADMDEFRIQLLGVTDGQFKFFRPHRYHKGEGALTVDAASAGSTAVFLFDPSIYGYLMDITAVGSDGTIETQKIPKGDQRCNLRFVSFSTLNADEITAFRGRYLSNYVRAIFPIDRLAGIPEANQNIENLFNVRIPYARVERMQSFQVLIGGATQMEMMSWGEMRDDQLDGYFPKTFTDVTPADLLEEFQRLSPAQSFETPPNEFKIVPRTDLPSAWDKTKNWWRGLWE